MTEKMFGRTLEDVKELYSLVSIFDIFSTSLNFSLFDIIVDMTRGFIPLVGKTRWSKTVQERNC